jgi:hypothetical protein
LAVPYLRPSGIAQMLAGAATVGCNRAISVAATQVVANVTAVLPALDPVVPALDSALNTIVSAFDTMLPVFDPALAVLDASILPMVVSAPVSAAMIPGPMPVVVAPISID